MKSNLINKYLFTEVSMYFLLRLNEDFDDNLLQDAIELCSDLDSQNIIETQKANIYLRKFKFVFFWYFKTNVKKNNQFWSSSTLANYELLELLLQHFSIYGDISLSNFSEPI